MYDLTSLIIDAEDTVDLIIVRQWARTGWNALSARIS